MNDARYNADTVPAELFDIPQPTSPLAVLSNADGVPTQVLEDFEAAGERRAMQMFVLMMVWSVMLVLIVMGLIV